jgi:hypothetical protein
MLQQKDTAAQAMSGLSTHQQGLQHVQSTLDMGALSLSTPPPASTPQSGRSSVQTQIQRPQTLNIAPPGRTQGPLLTMPNTYTGQTVQQRAEADQLALQLIAQNQQEQQQAQFLQQQQQAQQQEQQQAQFLQEQQQAQLFQQQQEQQQAQLFQQQQQQEQQQAQLLAQQQHQLHAQQYMQQQAELNAQQQQAQLQQAPVIPGIPQPGDLVVPGLLQAAFQPRYPLGQASAAPVDGVIPMRQLTATERVEYERQATATRLQLHNLELALAQAGILPPPPNPADPMS